MNSRKAQLLLLVFLLILCFLYFGQVKTVLVELWKSADNCLGSVLGGDTPLIWRFVLILLVVYSALYFFGITGKHGSVPNWRGAMVPLIVFILMVWIGKVLHMASSVFEALHQAVTELTSHTREPIHGLALIMVACIFLAGSLRLLLQNRNK